MDTLLSFLVQIMVFLHLITPVSAPTPTILPSPSATPVVSQRPVQKPVVTPTTDSPNVSKCKLEASLTVDKLTNTFIKSSESKLITNPFYRQQQLLEAAKTRSLANYELETLPAYERSIVQQNNLSEIDALLKIINNQLINSQKELRDNFNLFTNQQYNLVYLQCVNR